MRQKGDGEQKDNKEDGELMTGPPPDSQTKKSVERMMGRGERMRHYLVTGAVFYSGSDKAQTWPVVNQRSFLMRHPTPH